MQKYLKVIPTSLRSKRALRIYTVIAGVFILLNVITAVMYHNKSYPNTQVAGHKFGNVHASAAQGQLRSLQLLPKEITLNYKDKDTKISPDTLGITVSYEKTAQDIAKNKSWLPIINFVKSHDVSFSTDVDATKLQTFIAEYNKTVKQEPKNAEITVKNGEFSAIPESDGHQVNANHAKDTVLSEITNGGTNIHLEPETIAAEIRLKDIQSRIDVIKKQQQTPVTLRFADKSKQFTPTEIASWFEVEGSKAELADSNIQAAVVKAGSSFGILLKNTPQAVAAAKNAVQNNKPLDFTLIEAPRPTKAFTYCIAARGVDTSHSSGLASKLASVFTDSRGWGLKGQVKLTKVGSGCDFTVWLSAASQMPTFGAICDPEWSCRVGPNVVINFERWQNASPAWNASGGSLEDYRVMVINHETGHWFGFGHSHCSGTGLPAPVMQQQSINLQGCKFNPWPTASELQSLKSSLGI